MGLIKAGIGATGGTLADQWKEYFYCESMSKDVLATKGQTIIQYQGKHLIRMLSIHMQNCVMISLHRQKTEIHTTPPAYVQNSHWQ